MGPHLCVVWSMVDRNHPTRITRPTARRATLALLIAALLFPAARAGAATDALDEELQKIQQLVQDRDLAGARAELTRAMQEFPNNGNLYGLLGVVEASAGNYAAAEANLRKAIALIPHFTGAYLNLGRIYQENSAKDPGAAKEALDIYEKLLRFQPDNREAIFQSALLLERQGSFPPALDRLARLSAADQEIPQALAVKCAALAATGKLPEAAAAADRLLQNPQTGDADVFPILPVLESHGASDVAARLLRARAQRQGTYELFYTLGLLEKRRGNLAPAREALEEAAQYRPNDVPLLLDLARVAYDQHDHKGALGYLAHARDLAPQNAGIHFFWGIACIEESLLQEAYDSLKRAVQLDPENPYYNYAFGRVILPRTDASEAIPVFQKYRQLKPDDPWGLLALGAAFLKNHDNDKARPELEAAAKYPQTAPGAHFYLGRLENQAGDYTGALKQLQLALQAFPEMSEAHAEMGAICLKLKDYPQAEKSLTRALELRPENYTANLNLMILYQRTKDPRAPQQAERFRALREKLDKSEIEMLRSVQVQP